MYETHVKLLLIIVDNKINFNVTQLWIATLTEFLWPMYMHGYIESNFIWAGPLFLSHHIPVAAIEAM